MTPVVRQMTTARLTFTPLITAGLVLHGASRLWCPPVLVVPDWLSGPLDSRAGAAAVCLLLTVAPNSKCWHDAQCSRRLEELTCSTDCLRSRSPPLLLCSVTPLRCAQLCPPPAPRMKLKYLRWQAVGVWKWNIDADCSICRNPFEACWSVVKLSCRTRRACQL